MARIRTVKPEFFTSAALARVPLEARYLFVGVWTQADDAGRLIDSPKMLAGAIFPHDEKVTSQRVDAWLSALEELGVITRYETGSGRYISVVNWKEHQRISHPTPSKLPNPSGDEPENLPGERKGREQGREQGIAAAPESDSRGVPSGLAGALAPILDGPEVERIAGGA